MSNQGSEDHKSDQDTPPATLALPTTATELMTVVQHHGPQFLEWIKQAQALQDQNNTLQRDQAAQTTHIATLNQHIVALDQTITNHEQEGTLANDVINELRNKLAVAEQQIQDVNAQASLNAARGIQAHKSEKMPDPALFDGDQKKIRGWMADMNMKLRVNRDRYPALQDRLAYIVSRTTGDAKEQLLPYVKADGDIDFATTESCFGLLTTAFDDPDRKATALRKLRTLKQGNKPFNEYLAEFQRYVAEVDYNDEAKKNTLMGGISDELQDLMVTQDEPIDYNAAIATLSKLDSKRRARNIVYTYTRKQTPRPALLMGHSGTGQDALQSSSYRHIPRPSVPTITTHAQLPRDPDAMDLSAAQRTRSTGPRGPISDEEKQRRFDENLCIRCARPGHIARECPLGKREQFLDISLSLLTEPAQPERPYSGNENPST